MDPAKFGCTGTVFAKSETMRLDRKKIIFKNYRYYFHLVLFCFCSVPVSFNIYIGTGTSEEPSTVPVVDKIFYVEVFFKLVFFFSLTPEV